MLVSGRKHMHVKTRLARMFIDWLVSEPGQRAIAAYRVGGEQLFFPNAQASRTSFVPASTMTIASTSSRPF
jgi:tungstate transport system substrate-binding protein